MNLIKKKCILFLLLLVPWIVNAETLPPYTTKVAENVYSWGNPAFAYFSMFVVTKKGVLVFETVNSQHSQGLLSAIQQITDRPIRYVFHSHNHWDHANGGAVFQSVGAKTVAHKEAAIWMKANPHADLSLPDIVWKGDKKVIELGDVEVELHYLGMNHGMGMTVFVLPEQRIAYIADLVTPNRVLFTIVPDFNISAWLETLQKIEDLDFDNAVYSHSGHLGFSTMQGRFNKTSGALTIDRAKKTGSVDITIDAASVSTGFKKRDDHLRSPDFLNAAEFPKITYRSKKIVINNNNTARVEGTLTILGKSKPVILVVSKMKCGIHPMDPKKTKYVCGFDASAKIKRSDFGIKYGIPAIGDEMELSFEVEAVRI